MEEFRVPSFELWVLGFEFRVSASHQVSLFGVQTDAGAGPRGHLDF